jgi:DUF1009 family protein
MKSLGLIAGKGSYPFLVAREARAHGVGRIVLAAFEGETDPALAAEAGVVQWMRVGQLGRLLDFFRGEGVSEAMMAGQITPGRLFDLRPDFKALFLLAKLRSRNAESLFGAVADELEKAGVRLLPAVTYLDEHLATPGLLAGPAPGRGLVRDIEFGWPLVKQIAALDIGQTLVVKKGTVLAVEGFDGTDETIRRGGRLGKGGAVVLKVSKPDQDFRFDVPVIGPATLRSAAEGGVGAIVCEAKKTLLLDRAELSELARLHRITVWGHA